MKIAIDARFFGEAGPGRYVAELLKNLEKIDAVNDYVVYLKQSNFGRFVCEAKNFQKKLADYRWYSFSEQIFFLLTLYRENFDLVHFTQINVPFFYRRPFVVTIHDLILHEYSTERGTLLRRFLYRLKRLPYFLVFAKAVSAAQEIIVPSQATKDDLLKHYHVHPNKIVVTHEAVDHYPSSARVGDRVEVLEKYGLKKPYLLSLGSFYPHKNIPRLVAAFKILKEKKGFSGQLVLVGKESDFSRILRQKVAEEGIREIVFPGAQNVQGYLPDPEVEVILANAHVFIQPALKEGFGLPPVEAMVFGVPTVVSEIDCLREMCGEASVYFDPTDANDMAVQIKLIIENEPLRKELVRKGHENVKRFSWAKMAQETLEVYNSLKI